MRLLKDQMNTASGKKITTERQQYMAQFLKQFYDESHGFVSFFRTITS
jgi:hypothetical protein